MVFSEPVAELGNARTTEISTGGFVGVRAYMHEPEELAIRPYCLVEDIEATLARAVGSGAEVAHPALEIPGCASWTLAIIEIYRKDSRI